MPGHDHYTKTNRGLWHQAWFKQWLHDIYTLSLNVDPDIELRNNVADKQPLMTVSICLSDQNNQIQSYCR